MASPSRAQGPSLRSPLGRKAAHPSAPASGAGDILASAVEPVSRSKKREISRFLLESLEQRQMLTRAVGIDVSHYQGTVDWVTVHAAGKSFAYQKATEGVGVTDPMMATNMSNGVGAGMLMGVYHLATPSTATNDALNEANYFVQQARQYMTAGYLPPALDVSDGSAMGKTALSAWVNTFETTVKNATGVDPLIYTNNSYITSYLDSSVTTHPLWLARWTNAYGDPTTTGAPPTGVWGTSGKTWTEWQYSSTGTVAGVSGAVDLNSFNGDLTALRAYAVAPGAITLSGAATINEGANYTLTRSSGNLGAAATWTVNWGDGSGSQTYPGTQLTASHAFGRGPNSYTISAIVAENGVSHAAANTLSVTVNNVAPVTSIAATLGPAVAAQSFRIPVASFTDAGYGYGSSYTASISWGDGSTSVGTIRVTASTPGAPTSGTVIGQHAYAQQGTYNLQVTVTDPGGLASAASGSLSVSPAGTGGASPSTLIRTGLTVNTQDPNNGYTMRLGDGVLVQPDGKIVVSGKHNDAGGGYVLQRYNADGTLDTTFGTGGEVSTTLGDGDERSLQLAIQPKPGGGFNILASGFSEGTGNGAHLTVARFSSSGVQDMSFGGNGRILTDLFGHDTSDQLLVVPGSGDFLLLGASQFLDPNLTGALRLEYYHADGTKDVNFGDANGGVTTDLAAYDRFGASIQGDGAVVVGGWSYSGNTSVNGPRFKVYRYLVTGTLRGTLDSSFNGNGEVDINAFTNLTGANGQTYDDVNAVIVQGTGSSETITVGGEVRSSGTSLVFAIKRFDGSGQPLTAFNGGSVTTAILADGSGWPTNVAVLADGRVLATGAAGGGLYDVIRYGTDGQVDATFGTSGTLHTGFLGGNSTTDALTVDGAGGFLIAGQGGDVNPDGELTLYHFGAPTPNSPPTLTPIADQSVYVNATDSITASFGDVDVNDTHTASINWGDGTPTSYPTPSESGGSGTITISHAFTTPGVYSATLTVTDNHGGSASRTFAITVTAEVNHAPAFDPGTAPPTVLHVNPFGTPKLPPYTVWKNGEVFLGVGSGEIRRYSPDGTKLVSLPTGQTSSDDTGMAFDSAGNLFASDFESADLAKFIGATGQQGTFVDANGQSTTYLGGFNRDPESIVFDAIGDMYVGDPYGNTITKFDPNGQLVEQIVTGKRVDWMDLSADQHTMLYTDEGDAVHSIDLNTGINNPDVVTDHLSVAFALRIVRPTAWLPDGGILVADGGVDPDDVPPNTPPDVGETIKLFDPTLGPDAPPVKEYGSDLNESWFAANLDPDGTSFWSSGFDSGNLYRFDLQSGEMLKEIDTGPPNLNDAGVTVFGEQTAAIPVNHAYAYQFHATDPDAGDEVSYSFVGDSHGAVLDSGSGFLTWTPTAVGSFTFTLRATDDHGLYDAAKDFTFTVAVDHDVNGPNHAPVISTTKLSPALPGRQYINQIDATDVDGDVLTWSLLNSPGVAIDPSTGVLQWDATPLAPGQTQKSVTVQVSDSRGGVSQRTLTIDMLAPDSGNHKPVISSASSPLTATVGVLFSYQISATDPDGNTLHYVGIRLPDGMKIDRSTGQVTWTPTSDWLGSVPFTVQVSDGNGGVLQRTFTIDVSPAPISITSISVSPVYRDPAAGTIDPTSLLLDAVTTDPVAAADPGTTFSWVVTSKPSATAPDPVLSFSGTSDDEVQFQFGQAGDYTIEVTATNAQGASTPYYQTITVAAVPTAVVSTPRALTTQPSSTIASLTAQLYDQFGNDMSNIAQFTWTLVDDESGATAPQQTSGQWSYTSGSISDVTDVLAVSALANGVTLTTDVPVEVTTTPQMIGVESGGAVVTEGQTVTYSGQQATYGDLAGFYDPTATSSTNPSAYTATVHWDDGATSSGVVTRYQGTVPSSYQDKLFSISGTHAYQQEGLYAYTIDLRAPDGRTTTIQPTEGGGILVQSAPITLSMVGISIVPYQSFSGTIATFVDSSPSSSLAEFDAKIDWDDGSMSDGVITQLSPGHYQINASHAFATSGSAAAARLTIYEVDDTATTLDHKAPARASGLLDINSTGQTLTKPTGVRAVAVSASQIEITWNEDSSKRYAVQRVNADGTVTTLDSYVGSPYFDQSLVSGQKYQYQVVEIDNVGNSSAPSDVVTAYPWSLTKPTNLTAQNYGSGGYVLLTWDDNRGTLSGQSVSGWNVLRATGDGTNSVPAQDKFVSLLGASEEFTPKSNGNGTVSYFDSDTKPHTQYWYEVVAIAHLNEGSQPSDAAQATTSSYAVNAPPAPTSLQAGYAGQANTTSGGLGRVGLTWDAVQSSSLLGYDVFRGTTADFSLDARSLIGSSTDGSYIDDVAVGGPYYYVVRAVAVEQDGGELSSSRSNEAEVSTASAPSAPPSTPTGVTAQGDVASVTLNWNDNSLTETEFDIYRKVHGASGGFALAGRVTADLTTFTDDGVLSSTDYDYYVAAHNESGDGNSILVEVATPAAGPMPDQPTGLARDLSQTTTQQIGLTWQPVTTPASVTVAGYYVYRRKSGSSDPFVRLTPELLNQPAYIDSNLAPGSYDYRVVALSTGNTPSLYEELDGPSTLALDPNLPPTVSILSPGSFTGVQVNFDGNSNTGAPVTDGRIRTLTPVAARIDDLNGDLASWTLTVHPLFDQSSSHLDAGDIVVATGTATKGVDRNPDGSFVSDSGQVIATIDPTLYPSGDYDLILSAVDALGHAASPSIVPISLYSATKLGNLTLPVTDLQFNVPGGQPITVQRVYDSSNANTLGDFGYGWTLKLSDATVSSTAMPDSVGSGVAFKQGDLLNITLPNGEQHAFQFFPVPTNYSPVGGPDPYGNGYATYWAQFVCVDGSGAKLAAPGDDTDGGDRVSLTYDSIDNRYIDDDGNAYDPAASTPNAKYVVTEADGTEYQIDAQSGQVEWSKDANDNETNYDNAGASENGYKLNVIRNGPAGTVNEIDLVDASGRVIQSINYHYAATDSVPQLTSVTNASATSKKVSYLYQDTDAGRENYLTGVIDARDVTTLHAEYNDPLGRLTKLTDASGKDINVGSQSDGSSGSNTVAAPTPTDGGVENVYDDHGNVTRQIRQVLNASGNVVGYSVSVTTYSYFPGDLTSELDTIFQPQGATTVHQNTQGTSDQNILSTVLQYGTFQVSGADPTGQRYVQTPTLVVNETDYYGKAAQGTSDLGLPSVVRTYVGQDTSGNTEYRVTAYSNYKLGKPQSTAATFEKRDGSGNLVGTPVQISSTSATYDDAGNTLSQTDASHVTTYYDYTQPGNSGGLPAGLLLNSYRQSSSAPTGKVLLSSNTYYNSTDYSTGAVQGELESTTAYSSSSASQTTHYLYDEMGNVVLTYVGNAWTDANGVAHNGWVVSQTDFDSQGRAVKTYQTTYVDGTGNSNGQLDVSISGATITISDPVYSDATQTAAAGNPHQTSATNYDPDSGQVSSSTDQYGRVTTSCYDINGYVVRTVNPDGTETRTVYDELGRVVWATDPFVSANGVANVTHTLYDSQGRGYATERYSNVAIAITDVSPTGNPGTIYTSVAPTGLSPQSSNFISSTHTWYDAQGRTIESQTGAGLRTGTIYDDAGQVMYSGVLQSSAPDGGHSQVLSDGTLSTAFQLGDFASYTHNLYNQIDAGGQLYDRVVDANGHHTDVYKDSAGRTIKTVFDDGSFTQAFYSTGDQAILSSALPAGVTLPDGLAILSGGNEAVSIAQRKASDAPVATIDIYDRAGNLVDVYEPAVTDSDPNSSTFGQSVRPHWRYSYDAVGNEVSQIDTKGDVTQFGYDEAGRKVSQILQGHEKQTWTYDSNGNQFLHKVYGQTNGVTNSTASHTTFDIYSTDNDGTGGRLLGEYRYATDFTPSDTTSSYADTTAYAERTIYSYDGLGRMLEVDDYINVSGTVYQATYTQYGYDLITGNCTSVATPQGKVNYAYDSATDLLIETWTGTSHSSAITDLLYGYDNQSRLLSVSQAKINGQTPSAVIGGTRYDANGAVIATTLPTTLYTYDLVGTLKTVRDPNGMSTSYSYDDLNRLTDEAITDTATSKSVFAEHLDLYGNGLRQDEIDTRYNGDGSVFSKTEIAWTYDGENRLTEESLAVQQGSGTGVPTAYDDKFYYDLANNRTREDVNGGNAVSGGQSVRYVYSVDDQLKTETETAYNGSGQTTPVYQTTYGYDADGNLSTQTRTGAGAESDTYGYNLQNRMTSSSVNSTSTTYAYDTDGTLAAQTTGSSSTFYLNDLDNPTGYTKAIETSATLGGAPATTYVLGLKVEAQNDGTNGTIYLLTDGHGSTRAVTSSSGSVLQTYDYDAFGKALDFDANSAATTWLFGGDGFYDPATGWTEHLDRWRDGFWFTQSDPTTGNNSDPISLHKYSYANDNPLTFADPTGHDGLGELLVDIGIDSLLNSITLSALKPAIGYVGSAIASAAIPQSITSKILAKIKPDAFELGFGASATFQAGNSGFGFGGQLGLEYLQSLNTGKSAWYGYAGFNGAVGPTGDQASVGLTAGVVWNLKSSRGYEGPFVTVTLPIGYLARNLQSAIESTLTTYFVGSPGISVAAADSAGWGLGKYIDYQLFSSGAAKRRADSLMKMLPSLTNLAVNFFFDPSLSGSYGVSLGYNIGNATLGNKNSTFASVAISNYWQEFPEGDLNFR